MAKKCHSFFEHIGFQNNSFLYKEYPSSGSSISITSTFGRIAGTNAAENAK